MNKPIVVLSAALAGSLAITPMYGREFQRERARAEALAERLSELEPVESGQGTTRVAAREMRVDERLALAPEPAAEQGTSGAPAPPKPVMEYPGTLQTRQHVERLQAALASATPLQEYQIGALIAALDAVRREPRDAQRGGIRQGNERAVQAAADVLFESQLEVFVTQLERDGPAEQ